jgi:hypothetical protein
MKWLNRDRAISVPGFGGTPGLCQLVIDRPPAARGDTHHDARRAFARCFTAAYNFALLRYTAPIPIALA